MCFVPAVKGSVGFYREMIKQEKTRETSQHAPNTTSNTDYCQDKIISDALGVD